MGCTTSKATYCNGAKIGIPPTARTMCCEVPRGSRRIVYLYSLRLVTLILLIIDSLVWGFVVSSMQCLRSEGGGTCGTEASATASSLHQFQHHKNLFAC